MTGRKIKRTEPAFERGQAVTFGEDATPARVVAVKFSPVSGWRIDVTLEGSYATWSVPESMLRRREGANA
jgi:hypothetical protein